LSVFPADILKTDIAKITKLDIQMFHDESWKSINFGVKSSRSQRICRSSDRTQYYRWCVRKPWWVFPSRPRVGMPLGFPAVVVCTLVSVGCF